MILRKLVIFAISLSLALPILSAKEWVVPLAGNAYRTAPEAGGQGFRGDGTVAWSEKEAVYSVYFHVDRAAELTLGLRGKTEKGKSRVALQVNGKTFAADFSNEETVDGKLSVKMKAAGYVRVDLKGVMTESQTFGIFRDLVVRSETPGLVLNYVKTNEGNMFYWGRRGPSVHLNYKMPAGKKITHAYSEVSVPVSQDPIGSYFMANGFGEGYFGMQVNSKTDRKILFSVWSPFSTNNPNEIPESDRIHVLASGKDVKVGKFGNEGSGGQSFLLYPWRAGVVYRFLTEVRPNGDNTTTYTAWFGEKAKDEWLLIASFQRPKTDTYYRSFHSFLENFSATQGFLTRSSLNGNQWVRDVENNWHEITEAQFSVDATGRGGHRLDYAGGISGKGFFMKNGGFFDERTNAGTSFERVANPETKPLIDLEKLPRK